MTTVVVISVEGREELWVADLDNGTVVPLPAPKSGGLKVVTDLRATGTTLTKGVNIAVVVKSAEAALSGHYDG
ncbi:hypothetical protein ACU8NH_34750 (plasmid) [Rhizobium leguminosarum]|jgi:hypothetical protein|uniref:hypothetical protein n=1 Tax=Rhizobium leguminosarum TaxID=384 RepID=UPI000E0FEF53|nr:hypothetical protein [Rhizobium leguminosarum]MDH6663587.1 hypothetical protein [Rhizobium sophorae]MBB4526451.1 hypothetical protein [Rhizobium leguminosarum]MBY5474065.1 hypothetical protein [Rhizobium leguminosarum]MBY5495941.1 hypothetical protein [Rhizobium leguminosarum]NKJ95855.1 hypothetical protein [Rhizobium leguminosarum bv. viciae]